MAGINALSNNLLMSGGAETLNETKEAEPQTAVPETAVQQAQTAENTGTVVMDVSAIVEDVMPSMVSVSYTHLMWENWFGP